MERIVNQEPLHEGKVNVLYGTDDPNVLLMRSTDKVSAENGKRRDVVPGKALANSLVSTMLYSRFEKEGIHTHVIEQGPDPFSKFIRRANMIKLEVILRNYAAGSFCRRYDVESGHFFFNPVIEYTYKSDRLDDPLIVQDAACELGIVSHVNCLFINDYTHQINEVAKAFFKELNLQLVDFKVEFGIDSKTAELMLCDEFSLDTCRLWDAQGRSLDKDIYRKDHSPEAINKQAAVYQEIIRILKEHYPEEVQSILRGYQE